MNITTTHTGTTPPIDQTQWEGAGAHQVQADATGIVVATGTGANTTWVSHDTLPISLGGTGTNTTNPNDAIVTDANGSFAMAGMSNGTFLGLINGVPTPINANGGTSILDGNLRVPAGFVLNFGTSSPNMDIIGGGASYSFNGYDAAGNYIYGYFFGVQPGMLMYITSPGVNDFVLFRVSGVTIPYGSPPNVVVDVVGISGSLNLLDHRGAIVVYFLPSSLSNATASFAGLVYGNGTNLQSQNITGISVFNGVNPPVAREIVGVSNEIEVSNGTGISDNPIVRLASPLMARGDVSVNGALTLPIANSPRLTTDSNGNVTNGTLATVATTGSFNDLTDTSNVQSHSAMATDVPLNTNITTSTATNLTGPIVGNGTNLGAVTPIADGTYTVGIGGTTNGTITVTNGVITAITEAS